MTKAQIRKVSKGHKTYLPISGVYRDSFVAKVKTELSEKELQNGN